MRKYQVDASRSQRVPPPDSTVPRGGPAATERRSHKGGRATDATSYAWVRHTREGLFHHCESLPPAVYTARLPAFGTQSIRDLCVHVAAQNYLGWIGTFALGDPEVRRDPAMYPDVDALRGLFAEADGTVARFLHRFGDAPDRLVEGRASWV